ncbi:acetate uptake transporter [Halalkalibaculum sp. DA384]|uniref:acetate uptake transporter n=1 Tax=Halalkalibaculum sp. DA384 TaxID=3373606 RepID=UPI00375517CA
MTERENVTMSETEESNIITISDDTANPAPLGLFAFGMCTVLLSLINAGTIPMDSMILNMGLFYGGIAQIMVGVMESRKGNTFGWVAFTSYGFFWVSFVAINVFPDIGWMAAASDGGMIAYLVMWCVFSVVCFIGTLKLNRVLQAIFGLVVLLFVLLIIGGATGNQGITMLAGYEGVVTGIVCLYAAAAFLLNEMYDQKLLPIGELEQA